MLKNSNIALDSGNKDKSLSNYEALQNIKRIIAKLEKQPNQELILTTTQNIKLKEINQRIQYFNA